MSLMVANLERSASSFKCYQSQQVLVEMMSDLRPVEIV